jgi:hypothetical protein
MGILTFKKLNQRGFDHVFMVVAFVVIVGVVGTGYLLLSHAASSYWTGALSLSTKTSGDCLQTTGTSTGDYVVLGKCVSTQLTRNGFFNKKALIRQPEQINIL